MTEGQPVSANPGAGSTGTGGGDAAVVSARLRRRRLLAWSALPVLLVLCLAARLLSLDPLAGRAAAAFEAKDAAAVGTAAAALQALNMVERHKAPFADGDAKALAGDYDAARLRFQEALDLAPDTGTGSPDACIIRLNLVLALEKMGDGKLAADDPASAAVLFAEALNVAGAAPDGCFEAGASADAGGKLHEAEGRLDGKLKAAGENGDAHEEPAPESPQDEPGQESAHADQLEQLRENARQSQLERNSGRERGDYLKDSGNAPGPGRPW
jgi:hypothetical protein